MRYVLRTLWMPLNVFFLSFFVLKGLLKPLFFVGFLSLFSLIMFTSPFSVSASCESSFGPATSTPTSSARASATGASVLPRRVASLERGGRSSLWPAHALAAARRGRVTTAAAPAAGVTVATAVSVSGAAAIVIIATASATSAPVGLWGASWRRCTARVTCRVNGSGNGQSSLFNCVLLFVCYSQWIVPIFPMQD